MYLPVCVPVPVAVAGSLLLSVLFVAVIGYVRGTVRMRVIMPVTVVVFVRGVSLMTLVMSMEVAPGAEMSQRAEGDPQTESDQCQAGNGVDNVGKLGRQRGASEPNDETYRQRGERVAETGPHGYPSGLAGCPSLLPSQNRDG
jgi:hypothetical protein